MFILLLLFVLWFVPSCSFQFRGLSVGAKCSLVRHSYSSIQRRVIHPWLHLVYNRKMTMNNVVSQNGDSQSWQVEGIRFVDGMCTNRYPKNPSIADWSLCSRHQRGIFAHLPALEPMFGQKPWMHIDIICQCQTVKPSLSTWGPQTHVERFTTYTMSTLGSVSSQLQHNYVGKLILSFVLFIGQNWVYVSILSVASSTGSC